jgi:anti-anti-sigma factor
VRDAYVIELALPAQIEAMEFDVLNAAIGEHIARSGASKWVVDLSGADYIGSALLGLLINVRARVRATKGRMALCRIPPLLERVMRTGSMDKLFVIVSDRDQALASL